MTIRSSWKRIRSAAIAATTTAAAVCLLTAGCEGLGPATDPLARAACPELGGGALHARFTAEAKANATIAAFVQASADLRDVTVRMESEVSGACQRIGADLGVPAERMAPQAGTGGAVKGACEPVLARIDAILKAGVNAQVKMTFTPPECRVEANAYASCAGQCNVNVDPGYIEAHCTPAQLSGHCEGTCQGRCEGTCAGQCNGECSATNAQGQCQGLCKGECHGTCSATCHAHCEGHWKAPRCEVSGREPSVDAKCRASCKAHAELSAQCTPGQVKIQASTNVGEIAKLIATLEKNLPILIRAEIGYGERLAGDIKVLVEVSGDLAQVIGDAGAHAAACISASGAEILQAQASIRVSVSVSASVSGRVSGKAG